MKAHFAVFLLLVSVTAVAKEECPTPYGLYELEIIRGEEASSFKVFVGYDPGSTDSTRDYQIYDRFSLDELRVFGRLTMVSANEECAGYFEHDFQGYIVKRNSIRQGTEIIDGRRYDVVSFRVDQSPVGSPKFDLYRFKRPMD